MTLHRTKPMKRSGFKAKSGLTGLLSVASRQLIKRKPLKAKRKAVPKHEEDYYRRVATLPCVACGIWNYSQCAHSNLSSDGKGLGKKAHYKATFPLCCDRPGVIGCHSRHDRLIGMTREEADAMTPIYIADTQSKLQGAD